MKHLPNIVTLIRILCSPLIVILLLLATKISESSSIYYFWAFAVYVIAASTDWVDGALARALNAKSELGAKLDLWADKLLVGLVIFGITISNIIMMLPHLREIIFYFVPGLFLLVSTSLRDYLVTKIRAKGKKMGVSMPATFLAKTKTAVIMTGIGIYMFGGAIGNTVYTRIGFWITIFGALMSLYTGWQYYSAYIRAKATATEGS